ncbi:MAG TPA: alpha-1,4-glucan--maltose-1-phosphate maltosyltransferase [Terriglobia bacterium]|nr:alpha-1,4-glucan--maltose-1-phosphate maltosyltransferase [Terriglobia bacterium]
MPDQQADGRRRVVIERVRPQIDSGRFAIKRVVGERVIVEARVFADGHDQIACQLLYRHEEGEMQTSPMKPLGTDLWRGEFPVLELGKYRYTVEGWIDRFRTWRTDLTKRIAAEQNLDVEILAGARLIEMAAERASRGDAEILRQWVRRLREAKNRELQQTVALDEELLNLIQRYPERDLASRYEKKLDVIVDREKARFSTWYEVFPRSCSPEPGRHGSLRDCEARLKYIASMGFDVVYLPPIHPVGHTFRRGKNNTSPARQDDVGSPWAVGAEEGGHTSVHPQLGTLDDFKHFVSTAKGLGLEVALDIAFQCSPDHPYVKQHREWFRTRPDGSIQYAENPPKKYEDIYPIDFGSSDWQALWAELKGVFDFWIEQGVRIFRVDNPHTKPFPFWEWVIGEIKRQNPEVLFLAEAFTRPSVMYRLAKLGFTQSYTYFAWRNTKEELTEYFRELTQTETREYFRPNLWPNTPDILPEPLQVGGRPEFMIRLILAATLGANYGIYGPAFELCENSPIRPGSEEYLNSEKYELKQRDLNSAASLKELIARINGIRRENPAMQSDLNLRFHATDNPSIICYSKATEDFSNIIVVIVNLDPSHTQAGWIDLDPSLIGLMGSTAFQVHDLLSDGRFLWQGARNYVELEPESLPAHILHVRRWVRTERDFAYYL